MHDSSLKYIFSGQKKDAFEVFFLHSPLIKLKLFETLYFTIMLILHKITLNFFLIPDICRNHDVIYRVKIFSFQIVIKIQKDKNSLV